LRESSSTRHPLRHPPGTPSGTHPAPRLAGVPTVPRHSARPTTLVRTLTPSGATPSPGWPVAFWREDDKVGVGGLGARRDAGRRSSWGRFCNVARAGVKRELTHGRSCTASRSLAPSIASTARTIPWGPQLPAACLSCLAPAAARNTGLRSCVPPRSRPQVPATSLPAPADAPVRDQGPADTTAPGQARRRPWSQRRFGTPAPGLLGRSGRARSRGCASRLPRPAPGSFRPLRRCGRRWGCRARRVRSQQLLCLLELRARLRPGEIAAERRVRDSVFESKLPERLSF
jgi:hypothetical protein